MCPLRVILIFLSATVAGFFVLRGLKSQPDCDGDDDIAAAAVAGEGDENGSPRAPMPLRSKVGSAICAGFWALVDMASGRYLWQTLVSPPAKPESDKAR